MKLSHLKNKTICILGYGREGQSTHQWLIDNQITDQIILADDQIIDPKKIITNDPTAPIVPTIHDQSSRHDHLEEYDIIIRTAGIAPHTDLLADYREKITSQTQIFFDNYTGVTIGVTGTKGKSTTSTLITHILQAAGHTTQLVGNIGNPVLSDIDLLDQSNHPDFIVYELSSFQLTEATINPTYAIITNLLEDHLDRHGSCDHYYTSKLNIIGPDTQLFAHASTVDHIHHGQTMFAGSGTEYDFDPENFATPERHYPTDILLPGDHNRENICLINALMHHLQIAPDTIYGSIRTFGGLPHRLQLVSEKNSIRRIDDSQSTNPSTCITAIRTYGDEISTLMLGGYQSHFDYAPVFDMIRQYPSIQTLILFPDTIEDFRKHITADDTFTVYDVDSMKQAIQIAADHTTPGSICLLSPGAKSFSLRTSMSQRGDEFAHEVETLP